MATTLYLASLVSGSITDPANALGAPNGTWAGVVNSNTSYTARYRFEQPPAEEMTTQVNTFSLRARKGSNANNPSVSYTVYDSTGALVVSVPSTSVSSTAGQDITATWTPPSQGVRNAFEVEIVASASGGGRTARNSVQIDAMSWEATYMPAVEPVAPVAVLNFLSTVYENTDVTLDGSQSYSDEGQITAWEFSSRSQGSPFWIGVGTGTSEPVRVLNSGAAGTKEVMLLVRNSFGLSHSVVKTLTVLEKPNEPPLIGDITIYSFPKGQTVDILEVGEEFYIINDESYDPDGTLQSRRWTLPTDGPAWFDDTNGFEGTEVRGIAQSAGFFDATFTIIDNQFSQVSTTRTIEIIDPNAGGTTGEWSVIEGGVETSIALEGIVEGGVVVPVTAE